nr:DUF4968 domain-containing protein [Duncaniella sp.]
MIKKFLTFIAIIFGLQLSARVADVQNLPDGVEFTTDGIKTRLQVVTPEIIRVSSTPAEFAADSSLIVLP